jgi:hypothetical protein
VLKLWPEGAIPADLPPNQQSAREETESSVIETDDT